MRTMYDQEALVAQAQQGFEQLETFVVKGAAGQELHEVGATFKRCGNREKATLTFPLDSFHKPPGSQPGNGRRASP